MRHTRDKTRYGVTIIELVIAISVATTLVLTVGVLLASGHRAWNWTYASAHKKIKQDAQAVMIAFGNMGRRSNRISYYLYETQGSGFTPAEPMSMSGEEVVYGDAVEFRYWDVELDSKDSHDLMNVTKVATAYAFFYLDGNTLKVDYGPYNWETKTGAVPGGAGPKNSAGITTLVLAENVSTDADGAFSHTVINSVGQGSVRIDITLTDPQDMQTVKVMTATLLRNMWPR